MRTEPGGSFYYYQRPGFPAGTRIQYTVSKDESSYSDYVTVQKGSLSESADFDYNNDDKVNNGKAFTPKVTVTYWINGDVNTEKALIAGRDYQVSYSNNKNVGMATITVKGIGNYTGTETDTFRILPKKTSLKKLTPRNKGFTVNWKKQAAQTTGYQIQYSFKKNKDVLW